MACLAIAERKGRFRAMAAAKVVVLSYADKGQP